MKNKKRTREVFSEHSYWQSYSDMLAALLLFFILIIAITMSIYKQKTEDLNRTEEELYLAQSRLELTLEDLQKSKLELEDSNEELKLSLTQLQEAYEQRALTEEELAAAYLEIENAKSELSSTQKELHDIIGVRTDIIKELQAAFDEQSMSVDSQTGSITFSSDVLFRYNSATLTQESKNTLKEAIPRYLSVLLQGRYADYIAEIIIEGHTDTDGDYESNMELSFRRANAVAKFCLSKGNGLSDLQIQQLQGVLTVNGRSYSAPIYRTDTKQEAENQPGEEREALNTENNNFLTDNPIDMAASRRVEIKFRLKEQEMIEKLSDLMTKEQREAGDHKTEDATVESMTLTSEENGQQEAEDHKMDAAAVESLTLTSEENGQ